MIVSKRIKASTLAGATAKLISVDPELISVDLYKNFGCSGVVLKSRVLELLDIFQDTYELTLYHFAK